MQFRSRFAITGGCNAGAHVLSSALQPSCLSSSHLEELGITLPLAVAPVANYVPFRQAGSLLVIAGQVPISESKPAYQGVLGTGNITMEGATAAARFCALNVLAQTAATLYGILNRIRACIRLGVFVAASAEFTEHPLIANGPSI